MEREDSLSGCCAFCLCPVVEVTPDKKQDAGRKVILEKFYTEFINNPIFSQLKLKKNGERDEDKPVENWSICGKCGPHVNKALGSKAKVGKVELEVRRLQRRVVEEMKVLMEEVDGMCGDMVMIEGILSNRDVNSEAATGRGMRGKCKEFKEKISNILLDLMKFQQEVGAKLVSSDIEPRNKIEKRSKETTLKLPKSNKRKTPAISSQPPNKRISETVVPVPKVMTSEVKQDQDSELMPEVKQEAEANPEDTNDNDGDVNVDSWHWNGNDEDIDDGPQSPELEPPSFPQNKPPPMPTNRYSKGILAMHSAKSRRKAGRRAFSHKKSRKRAVFLKKTSKPKPNDPQPPENPVIAPVPDLTTIPEDPTDDEDPNGEDDISEENDTSDEDFDPENKLIKNFPTANSNKVTKIRQNFIYRINQHCTIATSNTLPPQPTDDPRRSHKFHYNSQKNRFFVDDIEVRFLDMDKSKEDNCNSNGDKYGLGCSLCEYTIYPSGMAKERPKIEEYIFDHMLGKHLKVYRCYQCEDKYFENFNGLKTHFKSHALEFLCDICERPMSDKWSLRKHRWTHLSEEEKEDPSNDKYKPGYMKEVGTGTDKRFMCGVCGKRFRLKWILEDHEEIHRNPDERERVICESCGKRVLAKVYKTHKSKWCKPPRMLKCHICGDGVKNTRELNKHLLKGHPGVKTYGCDICGMKFQTKPRMRSHRKNHSEERNYLCKFCGRGFKQKRNCGRHERSCGGGRGDGGREEGEGVVESREVQQPSTSYQQSNWI